MIILIGFKGCGKTHFGKLLAEKLRCKFIDTDWLIEAREHLSCREIYQQRGEMIFRRVEKEIIASLEQQLAVLATGGGAILDPENREKLKSLGKLIYLRNDSFQTEEFQKRRPIYEMLADGTVNTTQKHESEILWEVIHLATSLGSPLGANLTEKPLV